jgi:FecR protein
MFERIALLATLIVGLGFHPNGASAQDAWRVQRSSGEVWIGQVGVQPVALTPAAVLNPGDRVRTGPNGRVLLVRGVETILISPNSTIGMPAESRDGTTTIFQESGSILLEVEKKAQNHFEVETPYLVAVVKGTQFQVSVDRSGSKVDVISGQVEVADLRSGQVALVLPGQIARVAGDGSPGLSLSGTGILNQIKEGQPRAPRVPSAVPSEGPVRSNGRAAQPIAIKQALGDVKLDIQKVTKGLARA